MAVSTDAQRIVAVSLGKIAASRATRSGINLYKSLMVSTVLYKARTVIIMEKYNGPYIPGCSQSIESGNISDDEDNSLECEDEFQDCDRQLQTTDIDEYEDDDDDGEEFYEPDSGEGKATKNTNDIKSDNENSDCDKENSGITEHKENCENLPLNVENSTLKVSNSSSNSPSDVSSNSSDVSNSSSDVNTKSSSDISCQQPVSTKAVLKACENTTQNLDSKVIAKCERCTKRRLTEVESAVESISPSKKSKQHHEDNQVVPTSNNENQKSDTYRQSSSNRECPSVTALSSTVPEPMDGVQMTHLVDSFSAGFAGLLSQGCNKSTTNNNTVTENCLNSVIEQCGYKSKSKGHGLSEAFNHCSTQIKESFEALASPIALSV